MTMCRGKTLRYRVYKDLSRIFGHKIALSLIDSLNQGYT